MEILPVHYEAVDGGRKRILIVEDDAQLARLYVAALALQRVGAARAGDGVSALRAIESQRPDLIVLDLMLPALNGWAVLHELKSNPLTSDIPIIVVTGVDPAPAIPGA